MANEEKKRAKSKYAKKVASGSQLYGTGNWKTGCCGHRTPQQELHTKKNGRR